MVKKGMGEYQKKQEVNAIKKILKVLDDRKWHRYKGIQTETKISTATLSKHLKTLEKGIVEKRVDLKSGEYPYPVAYRLKKEDSAASALFDALMEHKSIAIEKKMIRYYIHNISFTTSLRVLGYLRMYFNDPEKLNDRFNQAFQYFIIPEYQAYIENLKARLEKMQNEGEDVSRLIDNAMEDYIEGYKTIEESFLKKEGGWMN